MAVQKSKVTRSRRGQRRSHDSLKASTLSIDPVSGEKHARHQMTKDGFYKGETAKKIVDAMNKNNGLMSLEDFKNYKVYVRAPISTQYRGNRVFTAGPPSGGGITLLTALNILSYFDMNKYKSNSIQTYHLFSEALRRGHNNRSSEVGDPIFYDVPVDELLSKERAKELARSIKLNKASKASSIKPLSCNKPCLIVLLPPFEDMPSSLFSFSL